MICAEEFAMADEAFALSPISARAAQPSEQDYEAISEAFMETSRGRWFLGEYAKRNRNADTRMVLDAVARVEENLAAQKQAAPDNGLAEALVVIGRAVDEARAAASGAIDGLALEETLAPVRKGARVIREIAWRWREIGADGRICDLLDSQVNAIEGACGQIVSTDPKAVLSAAFDLIEAQIAQLGDSDTASPQAAETAGFGSLQVLPWFIDHNARLGIGEYLREFGVSADFAERFLPVYARHAEMHFREVDQQDMSGMYLIVLRS